MLSDLLFFVQFSGKGEEAKQEGAKLLQIRRTEEKKKHELYFHCVIDLCSSDAWAYGVYNKKREES